jgi:site-specific recombinase XerD
MRASELLKVDTHLHQIGTKGLGLYIPDRKNGDALLLPATKRVQAIVNKGPFKRSVKSYRRAWEAVRADLGLEDCVWHTFRHTCCSRLVQGGMDIRKVQEWMGHRNISTTMLYAHLAPTSLLTGLDILEA